MINFLNNHLGKIFYLYIIVLVVWLAFDLYAYKAKSLKCQEVNAVLIDHYCVKKESVLELE